MSGEFFCHSAASVSSFATQVEGGMVDDLMISGGWSKVEWRTTEWGARNGFSDAKSVSSE